MTSDSHEGNKGLDNINISDNGGRRKSADRREFEYTVHIPERRIGIDRRKGNDRRTDLRNSYAQ